MPVVRRNALQLRRRYHGVSGYILIVCCRFNDWVGLPLRLGSSFIYFAMLLTTLRYGFRPRVEQYGDDVRVRSGLKNEKLGFIPLIVLLVAIISLPFSLLGMFNGRTVRNTGVNALHISFNLGASIFLFWLWNARESIEYVYIFFLTFVLLPTFVEILAVLFSMRRGID